MLTIHVIISGYEYFVTIKHENSCLHTVAVTDHCSKMFRCVWPSFIMPTHNPIPLENVSLRDVSSVKTCFAFSPNHYWLATSPRIRIQTKAGVVTEHHMVTVTNSSADVLNCSLIEPVNEQAWGEWKLLIVWHIN